LTIQFDFVLTILVYGYCTILVYNFIRVFWTILVLSPSTTTSDPKNWICKVASNNNILGLTSSNWAASKAASHFAGPPWPAPLFTLLPAFDILLNWKYSQQHDAFGHICLRGCYESTSAHLNIRFDKSLPVS
jgi:hypothetical protein